MRETAAPGITAATRSAPIIMPKDTRGIGKIARDAADRLKQKCMFGMEQMSTILKSSKILQSTNRKPVQNAGWSLIWAKMDIHNKVENIGVMNVRTLKWPKWFVEQGVPLEGHISGDPLLNS